MIPTYIINLKRNTTRKDALIKKLHIVNKNNLLDIIWIDAVDGQLLKSNSVDSVPQFQIDTTWVEPNHRKPLTCGEVGCALSHWNIWDRIGKSDSPHGLIFEDDIILADNFVDEFIISIKELPTYADMAYIYRKALNKSAETKINDMWTQAKKSYWNCAYVITKSGATKLLQSSYINALIPVDEFLPMLYDKSCRSDPFKYTLDTEFFTYALSDKEICHIDDAVAFSESNTFHSPSYANLDTNLCVFTIADSDLEPSSMVRFKYSCETYGVPYVILKNPSNLPILHLLKNYLADNPNLNLTYILFLDYATTILAGNPYEIITRYADIVNLNELSILYPVLNFMPDTKSGFICTARSLEHSDPLSIMQIDYSCALFQNIENSCGTKQNVADTDFDLSIIRAELYNKKYESYPKIICSGNNKLLFNSFENYTLYGHKQKYGFKLIESKACALIDVYVYLTGQTQTQKSILCLKNLSLVDYPSNLLNVFVVGRKNIRYEIPDLNLPITTIQFDSEHTMHNQMMENVKETRATHIWLLYENYNLTNPQILSDCLQSNRDIVAPLMKNKNMFSNFWGAIDSRGYYFRSKDYMDILNRSTVSLWNVPYINGNILLKKEVLIRNPTVFVDSDSDSDSNSNLNLDSTDFDMKFCHNLRLNNELMYVLNKHIYGEIIDGDPSPTPASISNPTPNPIRSVTLGDKTVWTEEEFMHPDFWDFMYGSGKYIFTKLGEDVWQFPIFREEFCDGLIKTADMYGKWSPGNDVTADPRLGSGHENYPTQDIHMNQLGLGEFWETVVRKYYSKVMSKLYAYQSKGYNIAFVVRYKFGEQIKLAPHHDASVYTTNIALNTEGVDYEGGGCKFIYKNLSVVDNKKGFAMLHPGKLSHYHEGLPISSGTRYILVSFCE